jgi:hypothetical protein
MVQDRLLLLPRENLFSVLFNRSLSNQENVPIATPVCNHCKFFVVSGDERSSRYRAD